MRYVCAAASVVVWLLRFPASGQTTAPTLTITNYQLVAEQRISRTVSDVTYRADILNSGPARTTLTATVTSKDPFIQIIQGGLHFTNVPANGRATSSDTFTIRLDRSVAFEFANLQWTFPPVAPIANAGPNQTVPVGSIVMLTASQSSNPSGVGTLGYNWSLASRPPGSTAALLNATSITPTFRADVQGTYVATLAVSNGVATDTASVTISTSNTPPVADAGPNQSVQVGATVVLNGSRSSDVDGNPLTYFWSMTQRPASSVAVLVGENTIAPSLSVDKPGTYVVQLIVNDRSANSAPATVTITTQNTAPVANAGGGQMVNVGATVQLRGDASTDADGDQLTFRWNLITMPAGSAAFVNHPAAVSPSFIADRPGTYIAQLVVNDGNVSSMPATVTIATNAIQAPAASAGVNQTVKHGSTVTLFGSGTDPQGRSLTYQWSLLSKPVGSSAMLSGATLAQPVFVADRPGSYVAQLIVNNGFLNSPPATVTITTTNTAPVANAGPDQNAMAGSHVSLSSAASSDTDGDPLNYSWSFTSRPPGSSAFLSAANSATPTFVADAAGTYVVQLIVSDAFTSGTPDTVVVTVQNRGSIVLGGGASVQLAQSAEIPINLSAAAPNGGLTVLLSIGNGSILASSTKTVFIPEGATQPSAPPTITGLSPGTTEITATGQGYDSASQQVQVTATIVFSPESLSIEGTGTTNLRLTLSAPAPAGGLAISVSSTDTTVATVSGDVIIPHNETTVAVAINSVAPGTTVIRASALNVPEIVANVTVNRLDIILPGNVVVPPGESLVFPIALATPAPAPTFIALSSSDEAKVKLSLANIFINPGQTQPAAPPRVTGTGAGSATITATSIGLNTATTVVRVGYAASFAPLSSSISSNGTHDLVLTLSGPAPQNGLTLTLTSSNPNVATVASSVVFGATTTAATVRVTGVAPGSAVIRASAPDIEAAVSIMVEGSVTVILPSSATVMTGHSITYPITLSTPAPPGGVTVALASSDRGKATISPESVVVAAGQTQPAAQPVIKGVNSGSAEIRASAPGYSAVVRSVQITPAPSQVIATSGTLQSATAGTNFAAPLVVTVKDVAGNPVSGVLVKFTVPVTGASCTFAGGVNTATTNGAGLAAAPTVAANAVEGTYTVTASVAGVAAPAVFSLTNSPLPRPATIAITPAVVGQHLQTSVTIALPEPAPEGGLRITVRSGDPASMLVAGRPGDSGSVQIAFTLGEGLMTATGIYVQALASVGTAQLIVTAASGVSGSATITFAPSGVALSAPNASSDRTFTTTAGTDTQLTVAAVRLDQALNYAEVQQVRGGSSISVDITGTNSTVGAVTPVPVTINGGQLSTAVTFAALATGHTTLTASTPTGFRQPAQAGNTLNVNVISSALLTPNVTVGRDLQVPVVVTISSPAPNSGLAVTLTSSSIDKLLLSASPDRLGTRSITLVVPAGRVSTPEFYIQGLTDNGSATYTATAPGFAPKTANVILARSGFILLGPFGPGAPLIATPGGGLDDLTVYPALLDSALNVMELQQFRGGLSLDLRVTSSNPEVGEVTPVPLTLAGGAGYASAHFQPRSLGATVLSIAKPAGHDQPAHSASLSVSVRAPGIAVPQSVVIGKNLQIAGTVLLGQLAPSTGVSVTLSTDSSDVLFSATATVAGSRTLTLDIPAGQSSASYYLQATANAGSATYSVSAPGYTSTTAVVNFAPSGIVISGPLGMGFPLTIPASAKNAEFTLATAMLDPVTDAFVSAQSLAGGRELTVSIRHSESGLIAAPRTITIRGGSENATAQFAPLHPGSVVLSVPAPDGYSMPQNFTSFTIFVTD